MTGILKGVLSSEMIKFQNDFFTKELEKILYSLFDYYSSNPGCSNSDLNRLSYKDDLAIKIFERFKLNVKVNFNSRYTAAVYTFPLSRYNILNSYRDLGFGDMSRRSMRFNNQKGKVDLETAQVSGIFSDYTHAMIIDLVGLIRDAKFSVPELAAAILHEIGHVFTWYEYGSRLESTNQVLQDISSNIKDKKIYQLEMEFREIGENLKLSKKEIDEILNSNNRVVLGKNLFKAIFGSVQSQLPNAKYDETSSEQLADGFAARFGYGRYLITGIDKLHRFSGDPETSTLAKYINYIVEILLLLGNAVVIVMALMGVPGFLLGGFFYSAITAMAFWTRNTNNKYLSYDSLKERYKRIRQQYIELVKSLDISPKELNDVINNIEVIDGYISNCSGYVGIYEKLGNLIFSSGKDADDSIKYQQLLEELANNDLFLAAAKLKTVS